MGASDEAWYDGGDVSRPMTIPELCRKGPLKGVMTSHFHRYKKLHDYSTMVWAGVFLPMLVLAPFVQAHTRFVGLAFAALALGNLIVQELRVAANNISVFYKIENLRENKLAVVLENDRYIHRLLSDPIPGEFHLFQPKQPSMASSASWGLPTVHRSDGMGSLVIFLVFDDDHDRVMFRLGQ